ncbi:MAG: helix-turn-helix domain-containing protein [Clostridia bacterium]|nr:helix-turn-helix domain-containing protein [Clostridia bacterium]
MSAIERCVSLSLRAAETARKEPDRLVSRDEAAKMLGVTETTLYRWASRGYLTPVKIGVSVRYWMHDLISLTKREDLKGKRQ